MYFFLSIYFLNKWLFHIDLDFILLFHDVVVLLWRLILCHLVTTFCFLLYCYNVLFFVILLQRFICMNDLDKQIIFN